MSAHRGHLGYALVLRKLFLCIAPDSEGHIDRMRLKSGLLTAGVNTVEKAGDHHGDPEVCLVELLHAGGEFLFICIDRVEDSGICEQWLCVLEVFRGEFIREADDPGIGGAVFDDYAGKLEDAGGAAFAIESACSEGQHGEIVFQALDAAASVQGVRHFNPPLHGRDRYRSFHWASAPLRHARAGASPGSGRSPA